MKLNPAKPVPHKISLASGVKKNGKYYMFIENLSTS
jgi:hypothetical protein